MAALELTAFLLIPVILFALVIFALRREIRANWVAIALLAVACLLFFHRIVFLGEAISQSDANLLQLKFMSVYREAAFEFGEVPFWNPHEGTGVPNLAHPLSAMFYPLTPVFLFRNVFGAMNAFVVLHFFLGAVFALFLGRRLFSSPPAAFAFAALFAFNGWAITRTAHQPAVEYAFAYAWLPLAALAFEKAIDGTDILLSVAAGGAALAWMGTACPNFFVYGALLLGVLFVLRVISLAVDRRMNAVFLAVSVAVGMALFAFAAGAVELLPAAELSAFSTEGRLGMRNPSGWRTTGLAPQELLRLYFPLVKDRPFGVYYSPGVLALAAALYGLVRSVKRRRRRVIVPCCLIVLLAGAALTLKTPVYESLTRASDLFARASLMPASLIFLFLPVIVLAAVGIDTLAERRRLLRLKAPYLAAAFIFAELFAGFAIIYPLRGERRLTFDYRRETADFPHLDVIAESAHPGRLLVISPEGEVLAPYYALAARGLSRINLHESAFAPDKTTAIIRDVTEMPESDRLEALGIGWVVSAEPLEGLGTPLTVDWPGVSEHYENTVYYRLHNEPGWLAWDKRVRLYRVSELPAAVRGEQPTRFAMFAGRSEEPIGELEGARLEDFAAWDPILSTVRTGNTLTAVLPEAAPIRYFAAVTAYPGWRFYGDGKEISTAVAAEAFLAADIEQGTRELAMRFRPSNWSRSFGLAAAAALFAVIAAGGPVVRPRKPAKDPDTPPAR